MPISRQLVRTAIATCDKRSGNLRHRGTTGDQLFQNRDSNIDPSTDCLRSGDVPEILMGKFMGHDPCKLLIGRSSQQTRGYIELTRPAISRVNFRVVDDLYPYLVWRAWVVHHSQ